VETTNSAPKGTRGGTRRRFLRSNVTESKSEPEADIVSDIGKEKKSWEHSLEPYTVSISILAAGNEVGIRGNWKQNPATPDFRGRVDRRWDVGGPGEKSNHEVVSRERPGKDVGRR